MGSDKRDDPQSATSRRQGCELLPLRLLGRLGPRHLRPGVFAPQPEPLRRGATSPRHFSRRAHLPRHIARRHRAAGALGAVFQPRLDRRNRRGHACVHGRRVDVAQSRHGQFFPRGIHAHRPDIRLCPEKGHQFLNPGDRLCLIRHAAND